MRICLITRYFTFRNAGIGRVSSEIANRLEARGHEVCRISTDTWSLYQYFKYTTYDLMTKIPKGYDIYHALTPLEATWIPKDRGVVTFYDFIPVLHPERAGTGLHSSWILKHGSKAYFNWACKMATRCKGLTAISQETKDELRTHFGVEKDITVVKLGIRPDLEPAEKPDSTFRIGYLGQLDRRKRVGLLVEAFYNSEIDGELVIAGTGPEEVRLKAIADGDDRIKFLGGIPDDTLVDFYNSLDMFVFPTFIEGYSLPTVEAMACKKPVFVLSDSIIPKAVKSRCFEVGNLSRLFKCLRYWKYRNKKTVVDSNYQFAKSHDWEKCVDTYEAMYRKILRKKI